MKNELLFYLFLLVNVIVIPINTFAQGPDTLWTKIHSISPQGDIDDPKSIRQTNDGGYIITGGYVPDGMNSFVDVLLLKTDSMGNIVWIQNYDRNLIEEGASVGQTLDGGYIIGGRSLTGSYPFIEPPLSDIWIIKTDVKGDTLWTKIYGNEGNEYCTSIQETADSGYILTGTMNSEYCYPMYEINEEYSPDSAKLWLLKTNLHGDTIWTKTYFDQSYGNSVIQTEDGGYIIAGWIFPEGQSTQSDVLIIKTSSIGDTLWTRIIGEGDNDIGYCVRETIDGYIISGQTKPVGQPYDALVIKLSKSGDVVWSNTYGGVYSDAAFSVEVDDNGYFFTGATNGTWWVSAMGDMWAFKTNTYGDLLWERIYNIAMNDIAWCGIITNDGGYALAGLAGYGFGGDLWMAKLAPEPAGIKNSKALPEDFRLYQNYPNPFNSSTVISFSIPQKDHVILKVFDTLGKEAAILINEELSAGNHRIDFSGLTLPSGVYFYELKARNYLVTRKMILLK